MNTISLLPCPFCMEKAESSSSDAIGYWASCSACGAEGPSAETEERAALAWNRVPRALAPPTSSRLLRVEIAVATTDDGDRTRWSAYGSCTIDTQGAENFARTGLGEALRNGVRMNRVQVDVYLPDLETVVVTGVVTAASETKPTSEGMTGLGFGLSAETGGSE